MEALGNDDDLLHLLVLFNNFCSSSPTKAGDEPSWLVPDKSLVCIGDRAKPCCCGVASLVVLVLPLASVSVSNSLCTVVSEEPRPENDSKSSLYVPPVLDRLKHEALIHARLWFSKTKMSCLENRPHPYS